MIRWLVMGIFVGVVGFIYHEMGGRAAMVYAVVFAPLMLYALFVLRDGRKRM